MTERLKRHRVYKISVYQDADDLHDAWWADVSVKFSKIGMSRTEYSKEDAVLRAIWLEIYGVNLRDD